ncbi:hypothetical protein TRFO_25945 [Tritrichomonas foetus]|uniref:Methyltransferase type 11 domain-containing protein n=1 Tax=Tritrichomonas foetus TaxID=1144522 RepID=A0A1J4K8Z7_9EUKA|nr:hypothetical protein TRFO_25945 [Tritrichomonas foetus]|eukprot:OHT06150.1 hypothetical protein TRFO_25945 [Tritrichomonas foetus]
MKRLPPEAIEEEHVVQVYDEIAKHFAHTRNRAWPEVRDYVNKLPPYSFILDLGCGNGRNLRINKQIIDVGSDRSMPLCELAMKRKRPIFCATALEIPVKDQTFDHVICIAVIHHFASEERRVQCLKEICRIIKIGGTCFVTAWATQQHNRSYDDPDQMVPWTVDRRFGEAGKKLERFYHLFREGELAHLAESVEGLVVVSESYENDNWNAIFRREK